VGVEQYRRVAYDGGVDSMLHFQLEREGDVIKRYRKMKRMQRAHLGSIGRKHNTVRWCDDNGWRRGDTEEGKGRKQRQLD
jgi:hypothetical protein